MRNFLRFETMITPTLIQVVFWLAVIGFIIAGVVEMISDDSAGGRASGLALLILGPIAARIYAEILIVLFRINDHLRAIQQNTQHG